MNTITSLLSASDHQRTYRWQSKLKRRIAQQLLTKKPTSLQPKKMTAKVNIKTNAKAKIRTIARANTRMSAKAKNMTKIHVKAKMVVKSKKPNQVMLLQLQHQLQLHQLRLAHKIEFFI